MTSFSHVIIGVMALTLLFAVPSSVSAQLEKASLISVGRTEPARYLSLAGEGNGPGDPLYMGESQPKDAEGVG